MMAVLWQWKKMALEKKRKNKKEEFGNYVMEQQLQELS